MIMPTVVWIVDDQERLLQALQLLQQQQQQQEDGSTAARLSLQGIISNRPLQMQSVLRKVCGPTTMTTTTTGTT
jgi:hypothetical protein